MTFDDGLRFDDHRWVAHVLLARADRYLVLERGADRYLGGRWDLPGGTVEPGEDLRAAAEREAAEETGLTVRATGELARFSNADTRGRPICYHTVTFRGVEADPAARVTTAPEEHDEHRWLTLEEALRLDLVWHVRRVFDVLAHR